MVKLFRFRSREGKMYSTFFPPSFLLFYYYYYYYYYVKFIIIQDHIVSRLKLQKKIIILDFLYLVSFFSRSYERDIRERRFFSSFYRVKFIITRDTSRNSKLKLVAKRFCKLSKADRGKSPRLRGFKIARCTEVVANIY